MAATPNVAPDATHGDAISCITRYGIAGGYEDGRYRPGMTTHRAQMASFVAAFLRNSGSELPVPGDGQFDDLAETFGEHRDNINALAAQDVVHGVRRQE